MAPCVLLRLPFSHSHRCFHTYFMNLNILKVKQLFFFSYLVSAMFELTVVFALLLFIFFCSGNKIFVFGRRSQFVDSNIYMFDTILSRWSTFGVPPPSGSPNAALSTPATSSSSSSSSPVDEDDERLSGRVGQVACLVGTQIWMFGGISSLNIAQKSCSYSRAVQRCGASLLSAPDERHCAVGSFHTIDVIDLADLFAAQQVQPLPDPNGSDSGEEMSVEKLLEQEKAVIAQEPWLEAQQAQDEGPASENFGKAEVCQLCHQQASAAAGEPGPGPSLCPHILSKMYNTTAAVVAPPRDPNASARKQAGKKKHKR